MKLIIIYLVALLGVELYLSVVLLYGYESIELKQIVILLYCILAGGIGGIVYCLRGVYLSASVRNDWNKSWYPWYVVRPIVSLITGGVSYVFLNAGLLILESHSKSDSSHVAYYALAFVAGLNVDKFIAKIEAIAKTSWGVEKSRTGEDRNK
jgi:hypothetical protein